MWLNTGDASTFRKRLLDGELLARSAAETVVIAQIEEPEGVVAIAAVDALFAGPADLAVCYGVDALDAPLSPHRDLVGGR